MTISLHISSRFCFYIWNVKRNNLNFFRANRDKETLEHKLKQASRIPHPPAGPADKHRHAPASSQHSLEDLRRRNYELEEEVGFT